MPTQNIVVQNMQHLYALQNHEPGELAYVEETKEVWVWDEEQGWTKMDVDNKGLELNLYDLNKNIVSQLEPLTAEQFAEQAEMLDHYYNVANSLYHMLLCRDFNYYTIFNQGPVVLTKSFRETVCEIIQELGEVFSLELLEDGAVEIWLKPIDAEEPYAFYLFPYDAGVVYYG